MIKYLILQTRDTTEHEHNKIVMDIVNTLDVYQGVKIDALIRYTKIMSYFILSYDLSLEQEIKAKLNDIITVIINIYKVKKDKMSHFKILHLL